MSGMPYSFEQGTVLGVFGAFLAREGRAKAALAALRPRADGSLLPVVESGGLASSVLEAIPNPLQPDETMTAAEHLSAHWFGHTADGSPGKAWWQGWSGDAEEIMRWTLISALEVSLGVPHVGPGDPPDTGPIEPTRFWPVHGYWACGAALFQGWVGWHRHGAGRRNGVVNVVFTTPGIGKPMFATPHDPTGGGPRPRDHEDPARTIGDHGLWVVGQDQTAWVRSPTSRVLLGSPKGSGVLPASYGLKLESRGPVCIVAPSEANGGVLRAGRTFER
jgi:hypothetical protein